MNVTQKIQFCFTKNNKYYVILETVCKKHKPFQTCLRWREICFKELEVPHGTEEQSVKVNLTRASVEARKSSETKAPASSFSLFLASIAFCISEQCFWSLVITQAPKGITQYFEEDRQLQPPHSRDLIGPASKGNQASLVCHFQVPGREVNGLAQLLDWFQKLGLHPGFINRGHEG